jgi:hypothetical protein
MRSFTPPKHGQDLALAHARGEVLEHVHRDAEATDAGFPPARRASSWRQSSPSGGADQRGGPIGNSATSCNLLRRLATTHRAFLFAGAFRIFKPP